MPDSLFNPEPGLLRFPALPAPLQLLFLLLRTRLSVAERHQAQTLAQTLTATAAWPRFLLLAEHHRVAPLIFHLSAGLALPLPPDLHAPLKKIAARNAFHALEATAQLARLHKALAAQGSAFTALKGVALSARLYATPNARHVGDLDVLVAPANLPEPANLPAQIEALAACGYTLLHPAARLTPRRIRAYTRFWKDATFLHPPSGFELDLHWRLFNHSLHPANRLLANPARVQVTVFNTTLPVLPLPEQFLYACAHGVSDAFTFAKSLADVAAFLRLLTPQELDQSLTLATRIGLLPQVSAAIHLVDAWLGTTAASPRLLPPQHPLARALAHTASANLLAHDYTPPRDARTPLEWLLWEQRLIPGPPATLERLRRFLWRPRPWSRVDLPDPLFWLYPAIALLRRRHQPEVPQPLTLPASTTHPPLH